MDQSLTNAPPAPLQLRPPRHLVSPRATWYWFARALVGWVVFAVLQVALIVVVTQGDQLGLHLLGLAATAVVAAAHLVVMPRWRYAVHRWEVTPTAVYTQAGWFSQQRRIAPISRIQTVDTARGPLEQLFSLANVTVTTASAAGPLKIHGLDRDLAQTVVDQLTHATEATRGDAT